MWFCFNYLGYQNSFLHDINLLIKRSKKKKKRERIRRRVQKKSQLKREKKDNKKRLVL